MSTSKIRSSIMATVSSLMTTEELLALPEDGTDRWLIAGKLRERPITKRERSMTKRNRFHSRTMARVAKFLDNWLDEQPEPRGQVLVGEAGVILGHDPDTTVGIDVTYISAEVLVRQTEESTLIDGVPTLVVEILSPSDTIQDINEKIDAYLAARVAIIWIIDPYRRTITVHSPDCEPKLYNMGDELSAEPHLPGLRIPVAQLFR
jgi:Uma2 family endonuclease